MDTFKFEKAVKKHSLKPTSEWESKRFVCTYKNRPSKDEYCEDMLKMCIYYGDSG